MSRGGRSGEPAEAVDVVEARVGLEADLRSRRKEVAERGGGLGRVALAFVGLGCVDLHEADAPAVAGLDRVAVDHAGDGGLLGGRVRADAQPARARIAAPTANKRRMSTILVFRGVEDVRSGRRLSTRGYCGR